MSGNMKAATLTSNIFEPIRREPVGDGNENDEESKNQGSDADSGLLDRDQDMRWRGEVQ